MSAGQRYPPSLLPGPGCEPRRGERGGKRHSETLPAPRSVRAQRSGALRSSEPVRLICRGHGAARGAPCGAGTADGGAQKRAPSF